MKRILLIGLCVLFSVSVSGIVYGQTAYLGVGASYNLEGIDFDQFEDDASGLNFRFGIKVNETIALEVNIDQTQQFENIDNSQHFDLTSFSFNGKYIFPFSSSSVQPFITAGVGLLFSKSNAAMAMDETDMGVNFGAGIDLFVTDALALCGSVKYFRAFGDLEDVNFTQIMVGTVYYF